jgi:hypothetical protein
MQGRVLSGHYQANSAIWFELTGRDPSTGEHVTRWQRVMWHPALDAIRGRVEVGVHGAVESKRRAVIDLPDGTRVFPASRLRQKEPRSWVLTERESARDDLAEAFILPAGAVLEAARAPWWRRVAMWSGVGVVAGSVAGLLIGGPVAVLPFGVSAAALAAYSWAFSGGDPTG